jgi:hypothetical protein
MIIVGIMVTQLNAGAVNMINSLKKLGWNYEIIGKNVKWEGWETRMIVYADFCSSKEVNDVIVLIDAYDALSVKYSNGFEELFNSFQLDIIVGAENYCGANCLPIHKFWSRNTPSQNGNQYVQGGCIVGKAGSLADMYRWCLSKKISDDQMAIAQYIEENTHIKIGLDADNKISFHDNWGCTGKFSISSTGVSIQRDQFFPDPYFVHFPGFLVWKSIPLIHGTKNIELQNYNTVAKHILGDDFVVIGQVHSESVKDGTIVTLFIVASLLFLLFLFIILFGIYQRKYSCLKKTKCGNPLKKMHNVSFVKTK